MSHGRSSSHVRSHKKLHGWFPDQNQWNEKLYPFWEKGDPRWNNCWRGGKVEARLTSDSPALVGSNVTFAVILQFPRCQKEDNDSNIIYDRNCRNDFPDQYVYNWTKWIDDCGWANCTSNNNHNVFPDGRPFPHHPGWRRKNFVYLFHTLGQYYQKTGGSSALVSINTTNITLGKQMMMVSVYRRGHRTYVPVATASVIYVVTDKIPLYVNLSQKNDRNASDSVFIKDSPITFDVKIHDPSHYLNNSAISYTWGYGDGSGIFISNSPISTHTYTLQGNFSLNLTVQAIIPVPCGPATPTPPLPTSPAGAGGAVWQAAAAPAAGARAALSQRIPPPPTPRITVPQGLVLWLEQKNKMVESGQAGSEDVTGIFPTSLRQESSWGKTDGTVKLRGTKYAGLLMAGKRGTKPAIAHGPRCFKRVWEPPDAPVAAVTAARLRQSSCPFSLPATSGSSVQHGTSLQLLEFAGRGSFPSTGITKTHACKARACEMRHGLLARNCAGSISQPSTLIYTNKPNSINTSCNIYRYGHYKTTISIVEGILQVNIIQMTNVQVTVAQGENSLIDFVVTCQGSLPTDACTIVSDPTCQESLGVVCNPVEVTDQCLLTIRRAFNEPGTYCVNITLGDDTSQALTSALISVNG
uniref:Glycoprotein nmb n=1 Tax=Pelodiscus sinensis TaxID=13735 RepID=K7G557_PELSI